MKAEIVEKVRILVFAWSDVDFIRFWRQGAVALCLLVLVPLRRGNKPPVLPGEEKIL